MNYNVNKGRLQSSEVLVWHTWVVRNTPASQRNATKPETGSMCAPHLAPKTINSHLAPDIRTWWQNQQRALLEVDSSMYMRGSLIAVYTAVKFSCEELV